MESNRRTAGITRHGRQIRKLSTITDVSYPGSAPRRAAGSCYIVDMPSLMTVLTVGQYTIPAPISLGNMKNTDHDSSSRFLRGRWASFVGRRLVMSIYFGVGGLVADRVCAGSAYRCCVEGLCPRGGWSGGGGF